VRPARILVAALAAATLVVTLGGCAAFDTARDIGRALGGGGGAGSSSGSGSGSSSGSTPSGNVVSDYEDSVDDLEVGDCFQDPDDDLFTSIVDCDTSHDNEVTALVSVGDEDAYPGDDEIATRSDDACLQALVDYDGLDYDSSSLDYSYFTPTRTIWRTGDHTTICFGYDVDYAPLDASFKGARI
jgi:hypothetical protein